VQNLHLTWLFQPQPKACEVSLAVDLELRSRLAQTLLAEAMTGAFGSIMTAFESRARHLYDLSNPDLSP